MPQGTEIGGVNVLGIRAAARVMACSGQPVLPLVSA
jgi:hypothetical protein